MLKTKVLYSLADISIIPAIISNIVSRKECNPYKKGLDGDMLLPIIVAPMSCNWTNGISDAEIYKHAKINTIIPRTIDLNIRLHSFETTMTAFSLDEAKYILDNVETSGKLYICIDIANGHMRKQIELGKMLKKKFGDQLVLMGGNIANPQTYLEYDSAGFDFVRTGIGGGAACFVAGTKILMKDGSEKNIEDIVPGDVVRNKAGNCKVLNIIEDTVLETITINNEITCSPGHKFFTIENGSDCWIEAENLNPSIHNLVKRFEVVNIGSIIKNTGFSRVYGLEVEGEPSYTANGYIVHNCLTSTQTAVHYPMASLIDGIYKIKRRTKVVADGGISGYSDAIKCLALGADYVMMGKVFTKAAIHGETLGTQVNYYGMSTKTAQKEMGNSKLKTSEGKFMILQKEYTLDGWVENFTDYLRSAMSYTDSTDLKEFGEKSICQVISPNSSYIINNK